MRRDAGPAPPGGRHERSPAAAFLLTAALHRSGAFAWDHALPPLDVASLNVSARMRAVICTGDDPLDRLRYATRSEAVAAVIAALVAAGHDDATIAGVLLDRSHSIGAKPLEKGVTWVAREVAWVRTKISALMDTSARGVPTSDAVRRFPLQVFPAPIALCEGDR